MPSPLVHIRDAMLTQFSHARHEKKVETFTFGTPNFALVVSVSVDTGRSIAASVTGTDRMTRDDLAHLKRVDELVNGQLVAALRGTTPESDSLAIILDSMPPTPKRPRIVPIRHTQASLLSDEAGYVIPQSE